MLGLDAAQRADVAREIANLLADGSVASPKLPETSDQPIRVRCLESGRVEVEHRAFDLWQLAGDGEPRPLIAQQRKDQAANVVTKIERLAADSPIDRGDLAEAREDGFEVRHLRAQHAPKCFDEVAAVGRFCHRSRGRVRHSTPGYGS